ncbi:MAG: hypothetical protein JWN01_262 [Patescibacteria group bacterium]|nr:hypothetical protein [Patescibacteria group bacterium]
MAHSTSLTPGEQAKQIRYRDARSSGAYDDIWKSVGKCVFCDLRDKYVFFEENGIVMTVSLYAYIDGHFMIVPRRHIRSIKELTQAEWDTIRKFTYIAKKLIKEVYGISGMQLVQKDGANAQSTVDQHLHFHCVPFDAPDLAVWNYRKLKHTPLENAELYRTAHKKIAKLSTKFDQKYKKPSGLRIVCDLIIINEKDEILFEERVDWAKFAPDYITIPGGGIDDFSETLEVELAREVAEEIGIGIDPRAITLVSSLVEIAPALATTHHLYAGHKPQNRSLRNTYVLTGFDSATPLTPGDDCESTLWVPRGEVANHPRISDGLKWSIQSLKL